MLGENCIIKNIDGIRLESHLKGSSPDLSRYMSIYLLVELHNSKPNLNILTLAIRRIGVRRE